MYVEQKWIITAIIIIGLAVTSYLFNRHIDAAPPVEELPDGQTAWWVVLGTIYTLAGALTVLQTWFGWNMALTVSGTLFACFVASGVPMVLGDMHRTSHRRKEKNITGHSDPLTKAQRTIQNLRENNG